MLLCLLGAGSLAQRRVSSHPLTPKIKRESPAFPIDLNSAGTSELELLPRVGPRLAERIVIERKALGCFASWEEVDRIPGVGPALLAILKEHALLSSCKRD
ncbi:MAG: helix-hairpin-helix domain-containing protein [Sandaracinaceae bacterium]|nr:helix-hairpin-helix domain-containing protein [Sandaracinaceae bacterium]